MAARRLPGTPSPNPLRQHRHAGSTKTVPRQWKENPRGVRGNVIPDGDPDRRNRRDAFHDRSIARPWCYARPRRLPGNAIRTAAPRGITRPRPSPHAVRRHADAQSPTAVEPGTRLRGSRFTKRKILRLATLHLILSVEPGGDCGLAKLIPFDHSQTTQR